MTPAVPKSADVEEKTAPIAFVARNAITVSGRFGIHAATRSPGCTSASRSPATTAATDTRSCPQVIVRRCPSSRSKMIAGIVSSLGPSSRFSARLREASGKKRAPSIDSSPGSNATDPGGLTTPHTSQTSRQNAPGSSTLHAWSDGVSSKPAAPSEATHGRRVDPLGARRPQRGGAHSGNYARGPSRARIRFRRGQRRRAPRRGGGAPDVGLGFHLARRSHAVRRCPLGLPGHRGSRPRQAPPRPSTWARAAASSCPA